MPGYSNSEATKMSLIMAAGELFAEHGLRAITTRAIAEKAGENIGIIHYHFGGKDGLINAVMDFVNRPWHNDPLGGLLNANRHLLKTGNGRNALLTEMIRTFLSILFSPERPSWCTTLAFQIIQRDLEVSRKSFVIAGAPGIRAFMEFYYAVSGDRDFERAYNWSVAVIAPPILMAVNPLVLKRMHPDGAPSEQFRSKLESSCIRHALLTIRDWPANNRKSKVKADES